MYATLAVATDYDCWKDCGDIVHAADVIVIFKQNVANVWNVLQETVKIIGSEDWEQDISKIKVIFIIDHQVHYLVNLFSRYFNVFFYMYQEITIKYKLFSGTSRKQQRVE